MMKVLVSQFSPYQDLFAGASSLGGSGGFNSGTQDPLYSWHTGATGSTHSVADNGNGLERRLSVLTEFSRVTTATYTDSGTTLVKTGAFATYTWSHLDRVEITAGAGVNAGQYLILSKTDDDTIVISDAGSDSTADVSFTIITNTEPAWAIIPAPSMGCGSLTFDLAGSMVGTGTGTVATGAYTAATRTIVKAGAFPAGTGAAGDVFVATGGTGVIAGVYRVATNADANTITITTPMSGVDVTNTVTGYYVSAQSLVFKLYAQNPDGTATSPTAFVTFTIPYFLVPTANGGNFRFTAHVMMQAGDEEVSRQSVEFRLSETTDITMDANATQVFVDFRRGAADFKFDKLVYLTVTKAAANATLDLIPRHFTLTQYAPRMGD